MPKYLLQVNYTLDGVKGVLSKGGSARKAAAQAAAESVGGTLESVYFAFGSTDVFAIADLPDNAAAAALALTVSGSGAATVTTVVLLTPEEIEHCHADRRAVHAARSITGAPPCAPGRNLPASPTLRAPNVDTERQTRPTADVPDRHVRLA